MRGTRIADSLNKVIKCKPWTYGGSVTKLPAVPAEHETEPVKLQHREAIARMTIARGDAGVTSRGDG